VITDPLAVRCRYCWSLAGTPCTSGALKPLPRSRSHKVRVRDALAVAAHSDPVLDEVMPDPGPCLLCGVAGLGSRHRVIDAAAGSLAAGDDAETCALEYGMSLEAVAVIAEWAERWPGAWL
jgi:hypothetical protein